MRYLLLACLALLDAAPVAAAELRIAVAANFTATLERLAAVYGPRNGIRFVISSGSSGKHFAQISQGAPFDIFFSADDRRTAVLASSGHGVVDSRFIYAEGVLVLWSPVPGLIPQDGAAFLNSAAYGHLAIANPRVAPYGAAAEAVLDALRIEPEPGRLVTGQSIGQTFGFVTTGNADIGFVALSQVIGHERKNGPGSRWIPAPGSYPPIVQEAVRLVTSDDPDTATAFLEWIRTSATAREIIESDGYRL